MTTTFEPTLGGDCLKLVGCIRAALSAQLMADGCLNPLGVKVIGALVECLEAKLGGPRRGPIGLAKSDGSKAP